MERRAWISAVTLTLLLASTAPARAVSKDEPATPADETSELIEALQARVAVLERQVAELTAALARADGIEAAGVVEPAAADEVADEVPATTVTSTGAPPSPEESDSSSERLGLLAASRETLRIYGYFSTRYEKLFSVPSLEAGRLVERDEPGEWSTPSFHLMLQSRPTENLQLYVNLAGTGGEDLTPANFWGEYRFGERWSLRLGKTYRRFGLYNEILDAVPSYAGVEPPELFDADHLLLSRTTTLIAHMRRRLAAGTLEVSATTGNGEGDRIEDSFPIGADVSFSFGHGDRYRFGFSGYHTNGRTTSDVPPASGPPESGVLPWMTSDRFHVFGGYFETVFGDLTLQGAYWRASHDARRDSAAVLQLLDEAGVSAAQQARFLLDPAGPRSAENVRIEADYVIETAYIRASYAWSTRFGEFAPYAFWDWYRNPEVIANKAYGGDNEAGLADDGQFHKPTLGLVYRPRPSLAIKLDGSAHRFELGGRDVDFPELRLDVSFLFGQ